MAEPQQGENWFKDIHFSYFMATWVDPRYSPRYGEKASREEIRRFVRAVRPDALMGGTNRLVTDEPSLVAETAGLWREVCREEGVRFGIYTTRKYCYNMQAFVDHLLPLLTKLTDTYDPDFFFVDGAWLPMRPCHCYGCRAAFERMYGTPMPGDPTGEDIIRLRAMHEATMDEAIARIGRAVKERRPGTLLAWNNAYYYHDLRRPASDLVSMDEDNEPDWRKLSFHGAYLCRSEAPAELMVFGTAVLPNRNCVRRPLPHLKSIASVLLPRGVRYDLWQTPYPDDATIPEADQDLAVALGRFIRERASWCIGSSAAAEVAILASRRHHLAAPPWPTDWKGPICQTFEMLKQGHVPADVVRDETLTGEPDRYRLVVLPETPLIDPETAAFLHDFVVRGGRLLIVGPCPAEVETAFDVSLTDAGGSLYTVHSRAGALEPIAPPRVSTPFLQYRWEDHTGGDLVTSAEAPDGRLCALRVGKGRVVFLPWKAASLFEAAANPTIRDYVVGATLEALDQAPQVKIDAPTGVEVTLARRDGDLYVHFANTVPGRMLHEVRERVLDEVAVVHGIRASVRCERRPSRVALMPGEAALEFRHSDGYAHLSLPPLEHHFAVRLSFA